MVQTSCLSKLTLLPRHLRRHVPGVKSNLSYSKQILYSKFIFLKIVARVTVLDWEAVPSPQEELFQTNTPDIISTQHRRAPGSHNNSNLCELLWKSSFFSQLQHSPSRVLSTADGKSLTSSGRPRSTCSGTSSKVSTATGESLVFCKAKSQPPLTGRNNHTTGDQPTATSKHSHLQLK